MGKEKLTLWMGLGIGAFLLTMACERNAEIEQHTEDQSTDPGEVVDTTWSTSDTTYIWLEGNSASINGPGAVFENQRLTIQNGGQFWLTGTLNDGQIRVVAPDTSRVRLILNNVEVSHNSDAPLFVQTSLSTLIYLQENSVNVFSDGLSHTDEESNAAVFSKCDLSVYGAGTLHVTGHYKDGIASKDGLLLASGIYQINAADDGIRGKDYLIIDQGAYAITSGGDALKSDNEDDGMGYISIKNGTFNIHTGGDGIHGIQHLKIEDGLFDITCTGTSASGKALKAGQALQVYGGTFSINSSDDAVHSDADLLLEGGEFTVSTQDDAFHAESTLTVSNAAIFIEKCYEGLEAQTITLNSGTITLTASDDGINAASGSAETSGGPGRGTGSGGNNTLHINGGYISVYAGGDGIDANGSIAMTGGTVLVHGPTQNNNGALDYDGSFSMSGGTLVASGSSGMAQAPATGSAQPSVLVYFSSKLQSGTLIHLQDSNGEALLTFQPGKNVQSVVISLPQLEIGKTYTLYTGGSHTGENINGLLTGGSYTAGSLYQTFSITGSVTTLGSGGRPGPW